MNRSAFLFRLAFALIGVLMLTQSAPAAPTPYATSTAAWTLSYCHDGDTCAFTKNGKKKFVRFFGVDAPEIDQPFGEEAQKFSESQLRGKNVEVSCIGTSYDRSTCALTVGGKDIEAALVRKGLAMDSPRYSKGQYAKDQEYAQSKKLGMWSEPDKVISPFCWRWPDKEVCQKDRIFQP